MANEEKEQKRVEIRFGALSPTIYDQLCQQEIPISKDKIETLQKAADSITFLRIHSLMTEAEVGRARNRLFKKIMREIG